MPRILQEASHATPLPNAQGAVPSEWVHILPAGDFRGRDGRGPYRMSDPQAVIRATEAYLAGADMVIDYDHQTLRAEEHSGAVPAAGWVKALEARADGLWARVEWTPAAAAVLTAKEYRYVSPVFDYDTRTGEVVRLKLGALTNVPNLQLQAAASRQGDAMNELLAQLCALLNLPVTTAPEAMAAPLKALADDRTATAAASADLAKALGQPEKTALAALVQAVQSRLAAKPDPTQWVPRPEFDTVSQALAQLQEKTRKADVDQAVAAAMTAGKVPPSLKDWATDYASRDLEGFRKYAEGAPVISKETPTKGNPSGDKTTLTPEEATVAHAMGLTAEAFLAAKKED